MKKLTCISILLMSFNSNAIVIKHNSKDEEYRASNSEFPPLATFYVDGAHGTLIKPEWIVTAAHASFCIKPNNNVEINGSLHEIENLFVHKEYTPGKSHDIALVKLKKPVENLKPAELELKGNELNKDIWFIGIGGTGNGLEGETIDNFANKGVLRKAQNRVSFAQGPLLKFKFDSGVDALPLEGVSGGGDSGGPAYIKTGSSFKLLGVSSRFENGSIGKYGIDEVYSRISYFSDWISQVTLHPNPKEHSLVETELDKSKLPAGLTKDILPMVCSEVSIKSPVVNVT